jgi:hypothetical protein
MDTFCPGAEALPLVYGAFVSVALAAAPWVVAALRSDGLSDEDARAFRSRYLRPACLGSLGVLAVFFICASLLVVAMRSEGTLAIPHIFLVAAAVYGFGAALVLGCSITRIWAHARALAVSHAGDGEKQR